MSTVLTLPDTICSGIVYLFLLAGAYDKGSATIVGTKDMISVDALPESGNFSELPVRFSKSP